MKKTAYIWDDVFNRVDFAFGDFVDADDVDDVVVFSDREDAYLVCKATQSDIKTLTAAFNEYCQQNKSHDGPLHIDANDLQNIVDSLGIDSTVELCDRVQFVDPEDDDIIFDTFSNEFSMLSVCYTRTKAYWDGSEQEYKIFDAATMMETKVEYDDEKICYLNDISKEATEMIGDGSKKYVYPVSKIDDETVNDMFLVVDYEGWQNEYATAQVFDRKELQDYVETIGLKIDDIQF